MVRGRRGRRGRRRRRKKGFIYELHRPLLRLHMMRHASHHNDDM